MVSNFVTYSYTMFLRQDSSVPFSSNTYPIGCSNPLLISLFIKASAWLAGNLELPMCQSLLCLLHCQSFNCKTVPFLLTFRLTQTHSFSSRASVLILSLSERPGPTLRSFKGDFTIDKAKIFLKNL